MRAKPGQPNQRESVISFGLLGLLFLIGLWIFTAQFNFDMGRFGMSVPVDEVSAAKQGITGKETAALESFAPAGFEASSGVETYTAENLYEKIDGKADFYLDSGFRKLFTRRFKDRNDDALWFEVYLYDMASNRGAFSVFSVQRRPEAVASGVLEPIYTYRTANALYCMNGHYYIELVGSVESEPLFGAIMETRDNLRKNLPVDMVTEITELKLFPAASLVPESFKLYLSDVFGFEKLTNTFTARYKADDEIITAFFSRRPDAQDARNIAQAYHSFLLESGCTDKATTNEALKNLKASVIDSYGATEIIFVTGPFVAGVHEAQNQSAAQKLVEMLADSLLVAAGQKK
ncbi:MAG TPA: DUF6599 family protein [Sedimentisphaerales bacterium]|nr:DUF6599 family protein [Sedimentisphaerales bacterium]